ncbi:MAG: pyrroline-5-carboxylate reductase [Alphaproteobacteria bacterium PRO2]|nr:pyrroline-5-carboxylate reductase [Alphaproteobacteria bacterium PRO2]
MGSNIALIGCGKMGRALLDGWVNARIKSSYIVVEPSGVKNAPKSVRVLKKPGKELKNCDIIVLAVKPQVMNDVCAALKPFIGKDALILSIAAGRSISGFKKLFGTGQPIVRAMPNLPASVGKGISVAVASPNVKPAQKKITAQLLAAAGQVEWVKNEKLMDAVTAVSGSGPAYVFLLIETIAQAGEKAGLDRNLSMTLARQTVIGSAALAGADKTPAATLRKNVTSPGGTTAAALEILMDGKMQKIFDRAIASAKKRSKQLSS